eukprot:TRINITY_DN1014_c0_g1_i1.p1 TRINITY_DN1014_c0_g1~~TRINITY_DN1014_c0_g1_i1.p1  ORF type:complete len:528 (+),score=160.04 TRINITY_DN1014_c0_g1_i1:503-2086(+)
MAYNHYEPQPIGVMISSGQALSEKSQELQDFLKRLNYSTDFIKFVYQNEKESVRRRVQQCRFLVVLADSSWCKSEKCQLELSFAEEASKEMTIIPVLFETVEFFESYHDIKQIFSTKEVIDSRDSPNSSGLFGRIEALLKRCSEDVERVLDSPITISTPYSSLSSPSFGDCTQGYDYECETLHPICGGYPEPLVATFRPLGGQRCSVAFWSPAFDLLACNKHFQDICAFSERVALEALISGVDKRSILGQLERVPVASLPSTVLTLDPQGRRVHSCISFRKFDGLDGIFSYSYVVHVEAAPARRSGNSHLKAKSFPGLPSPKPSYAAPPATLTVSCSSQESRCGGRLEKHYPLSSASFQSRAKLESQQVADFSQQESNPNGSGYNVFKLDNDSSQQRKRLLSQVSPQKGRAERKYNRDRWLSVSEEENDRSTKRLASSPKGSAVIGDKGFCVIPVSHPNAPEEALKAAQQNSQRPLFMITPDDFQSKAQDSFEVQSGFRHPQKKRKECWENLTEDNHYHIYRGPTGQ